MQATQHRNFTHILIVHLMVFCGAVCFAAPPNTPPKPAPKPSPKTLALFSAIQKGDVAKVKELLKEGADPNARNEEGWTPLNASILTRDKKAQKQIIEAMLERKAYPNLGTQSNRKGDMSFPNGMTPLMLASIFVDFDTAELLLKNGAKVDTVNSEGITALMMIGIYDRKAPKAKTPVDLATLYIKNGADVNHKDKSNMTPLTAAINAFKVELVQFLLDKGADIAVKNSDGKTPLLFALHNLGLLFSANESYKEPGFKIVKALIAKGAGKSEEEKKQALQDARIHKFKNIEEWLK